MNGNNHSRVVKIENGKRVTFIQPRMLRRSQRSSGQRNGTSGEYTPHYYVARQKPRSPTRLVRVVRRSNDNYEPDDMYRVARTKRYESYTDDSESETDYSSEYSSGESDREVYVYPKKRKVVRVVPVSRNSVRYNDGEITIRPRTNLRIDNENTITGDRYLLERKQPARTREENRTISRMKPYVESDSDYSFSSDEDDVDSRLSKVRLTRVVPSNNISSQRKVRYFRDNKTSQSYTQPRPKSEATGNETVLVPVTTRYVAKPPSDIPNGFQQHLIKGKGENSPKNSGISIHSQKTPVRSNNVVNKSGITRSQSALGRDTGPQKLYGKLKATASSAEKLNQNHIRNSFSTISYTSSDSSDTDTSSSSDSSISERDKKSSADQTSRLLLDYSKMLKSREEQKLYEKARKNYEHEKHIVTLVQKEMNTPRRTAIKSYTSTENSDKSLADEKMPKPLSSYENVMRRLEEAEEIKENVAIEKLRKKQSEKRGKLEAWTESEDNDRDKRKINKNDSKQPVVHNLDKRKKRSPGVYNKSEVPDNIEVHVNYNDNFEDIFPEPRQKGCQQVYFIDLTKPPEKVEPKPFDEAKRRIIPQPKKTYDGPLVKVGGGWNTLNDYMERHVPVRKFEYQRQYSSKDKSSTPTGGSQLPDIKRKYYGFHSNYKAARSNTEYRPL